MQDFLLVAAFMPWWRIHVAKIAILTEQCGRIRPPDPRSARSSEPCDFRRVSFSFPRLWPSLAVQRAQDRVARLSFAIRLDQLPARQPKRIILLPNRLLGTTTFLTL